MAKSKEKILARKLRKNQGFSICDIANKLNVSKGSVSMWCSDIQLTKKQSQQLHDKMVRGSYAGRLAGAHMQKEKKRKKIAECVEIANNDIVTLSERELMIAGLSLYWGEGAKNCSNVRFYNSDPRAVKFMMKWFRYSLAIDESRFAMYININEVHKDRIEEVIKYWSEITSVSTEQFRSPTLIRVKQKKQYENIKEHHGTLSIRITKSKYLLYQILAWIDALNKAG